MRSLAENFGPQDQGPVVEPLTDDVGTELVGRGLQCGDVVDHEKGIVGFAEADLRALQLLFDEAVAVEVIAGPKRKERAHPHDHRAEHLVADVEIVVGEAAALGSEDPVIGVLAGVLWYSDAKGGTLLHTLEDKIDAVGVLSRHAALPGQDMIFLAHPLLGPLDRQPMVAGEGFHPGLVVGGALSEDLFIHRGDADHVAEEVHHLLGSRQAAQVTVYDDAIEAVVDKGQQVAEQLGEQFHGLPPPDPRRVAKPSSVDRAGGSSKAGVSAG